MKSIRTASRDLWEESKLWSVEKGGIGAVRETIQVRYERSKL